MLRLNEENIDVLIPMDIEELKYLEEKATLFQLIYTEKEPVGFIIALREGLTEYDFKSYRWFEEWYPRFLYIDRIVIDKKYWKRGLGRKLYQYAIDYAKANAIQVLTAAVTTAPLMRRV